jgi:hypothetical protein
VAALSLAGASVTYGDEQIAVFTARVTPTSPIDPTGTVAIKSGVKVLCNITLAAGTGHCSPSATALAAGTYSVVANYKGDTNFAASTSAAVQLSVAKATSKAALALSVPKVTYGDDEA